MNSHKAHSHPHAASVSTALGNAFLFGAFLNLAFVAAETFFAIASNSVSLLADAGHNFGDVLGLLLAWLGSVLEHRVPTRRFTYGFGSSSILAALFNSIVLLITAGAIAVEGIQRLLHPEPVAGRAVNRGRRNRNCHQWGLGPFVPQRDAQRP